MKTSTDRKYYWGGTGRFQKKYDKLNASGADVFKDTPIVWANYIYHDHFNNGSINTESHRSSLRDLKAANVSDAKEYTDAIGRIEECFDAIDNDEDEECPICGRSHESEGVDVWAYDDAFEIMMDYAIKTTKITR